jgi:mannosyltransferase
MSYEPDQRNENRLAMIGILLVGGVLRAFQAGTRNLSYDDAFAVFLAEKNLPTIVSGTAADTMPPLYYFVLHFWMLLTGREVVALRYLSLGIGLLLIALAYAVGRRLCGPTGGTLAALVSAFSPVLIHRGQELRMYSLLALGGLLYLYCFVRCSQGEKQLRFWAGLILGGAIAMYSHNLAPFTLLAADFFALIMRRWRLLRELLIAQAAIGALSAPWLLMLPGQLAKIERAFWTPRPGFTEVVQAVMTFTTNLPVDRWLLPISLFGSLLILVFALYRAGHLLRSGPQPGLALILCFTFVPPLATFAASYLMRPVFVPRGVITSILAYYVLIAWLIAGVRQAALRAVLVLPILLLMAAALPRFYFDASFPHSPFAEAAAFLAAQARPDDAIVHDNKLSFFPAHYYQPDLAQVFLADPPGSPNDTLAPGTMEAMGLRPTSLEAATSSAARIRFVVFQRALDEAATMGGPLPSKDWLDRHYLPTDEYRFNDLLILDYQPGKAAR